MVEPIMYLAIGFLISALLALMIMPLVHNRAVRLTTRRLEAATPVSMAEIQADKDQLRAEFAMSARRLEMSVDQLRNKTTSQLAELGKKSDAVNRLRIELGEKNAAIFALEAREKALKDQQRTTEDEFGSKTKALKAAEQALSDKQRELDRLRQELSGQTTATAGQQAEIAALNAQIEAVKQQVSAAEREVGDTGQKLTAHRVDSDAATRDLAEARSRAEGLHQRVGELETQLTAHARDVETLNGRIAALEQENQQLRQQAGTAVSATPEAWRTEKTALETQLKGAGEDKARLQRELAALQQQTETSWATERMENALLRERINDIAAEVAKLASAIEGPNSTIEAILAAEPAARPATGAPPAANGTSVSSGGTLADRIRALQSHASRARPAG
ncbi:hypothetical protein [Bradyrhizobium sp. 2TAF24]|uniref:hypothetical protein n=1 Tax=Bradyrhizobium sp. 2TAF24 TaxID=3233011 RepID=UPI003F934D36